MVNSAKMWGNVAESEKNEKGLASNAFGSPSFSMDSHGVQGFTLTRKNPISRLVIISWLQQQRENYSGSKITALGTCDDGFENAKRFP